jgi:hypothetical protein
MEVPSGGASEAVSSVPPLSNGAVPPAPTALPAEPPRSFELPAAPPPPPVVEPTPADDKPCPPAAAGTSSNVPQPVSAATAIGMTQRLGVLDERGKPHFMR